MCLLGDPKLDKAARVYKNIINKMSDEELMLSYLVIDVDFKFPPNTKYPSIPTRVDNDVDIYPLEGRSIITGPEYVTAKSIGCNLRVRSGVIIPFDKSKLKSTSTSTSSSTSNSSISSTSNSSISSNTKSTSTSTSTSSLSSNKISENKISKNKIVSDN
jgi:hypothetical protein